MGGLVGLLWWGLPILQGTGLSPRFARLAVVIGAGIAAFLVLSMLLRDENLAVLRRRGPAEADMEKTE